MDLSTINFSGYKFNTDLIKEVKTDNFKKHIKFLCSKKCAGRKAGTQGIENSRKYITENFKKNGLKPFKAISDDYKMDSFFQTRYIQKNYKNNELLDMKKPIIEDSEAFRVSNIMGCIEGEKSDEYVIVMAHHDHFGRDHDTGALIAGADDNASGVASLLEISRILGKTKPKRNIVFVATEGEELGALGAGAFAQKLKEKGLQNKVKVINIDSIGAKGDKITIEGKKGIDGNRPIANLFFKTARKLDIPYINSPENYRTDADTMEKQGFPAISILWHWKDSCSNRPGYHNSMDKPQFIQYKNVKKSTNVVLAALDELANK